MKEEFDALSKSNTWDLVTLPPGSLWLVLNGSIRSKLTLMGPLSAIKLFFLQNVLHRSMGLIMNRTLLRLLESHLSVPFLLLPLPVNEIFFKWMSKIPSVIGI